MRYFLYVLILFFGLGASDCDKHRVKIDSSALAVEANDFTVFLAGCGNQPTSGYTYCRVREGASTEAQSLIVYVPPTACPEESCVLIRFFDLTGQLAYSFQVPRGTTRHSVKWSELVDEATFEKWQRGFWTVVIGWKYIGPDGRVYNSIAFGEIRLRVLDEAYESLNGVHSNENFVWAWSDGRDQFRMTTSGRASTWRD